MVQELVEAVDALADEDRVEVVPDPALRRHLEYRVWKIPAHFLMHLREVGVAAVQKPVWDLESKESKSLNRGADPFKDFSA